MQSAGIVLVVVLLLPASVVDASHYHGGIITVGIEGSLSTPELNITTKHAFRPSSQVTRNLRHYIKSPVSQRDDSVHITVERYGNYADFDAFANSSIYRGIALEDVTLRVGYTGCCWSNDFGAQSWDIYTQFSVAPRLDTGLYNHLPQVNCPLQFVIIKSLLPLSQCRSIDLHVTDDDVDDGVLCRQSVGVECGNQCSYNAARPGKILPSCVLDFSDDLNPNAGKFLLNLAIIDFVPGTPPVELSSSFAQLMLLVSETGFPPNDLSYSVTPPSNGYLPTPHRPGFAITYDEPVFLNPTSLIITFVDSNNMTRVFHQIDTASYDDMQQMKFGLHSIDIYPAIDFGQEIYQGLTISIIVSEGLVLSETCQAKSVPIEFGFWLVKIDENECDDVLNPCGLGIKCRDDLGTYHCDCDKGYTYSVSRQRCSEMLCPNPPNILNASLLNHLESGYFYKDTINYTCDEGFIRTSGLKGEFQLTCSWTGNWVGLDQCEVVDCGMPDPMLFSNAVGNSSTYNEQYHFNCKPGFQSRDGRTSLLITCEDSGAWRGRSLCEDIDECAEGKPCKSGHCANTVGSYVCTCLEVGSKWSALEGDCIDIRCPHSGAITNAATRVPTYGLLKYNSIVSYTCEVGYTRTSGIQGDITLTCDVTGHWVGMDNCSVVVCKDPGLVMFATKNSSESDLTYNYYVTYTCNPGFKTADGQEEFRITCDENGDWQGRSQCEDIDECDKGNPCKSGHCTNTVGSYVCTCLKVGSKWSESEGDCIDIQCQHPGNITNAATRVPTDALLKYDSVVIYTCDVGYTRTSGISGDISLTCDVTGHWVGMDHCSVVVCKDPGLVMFATKTSSELELTYNYYVTYTCNPGFKTADGHEEFRITCDKNGDWQGRRQCEDVDECSANDNPCDDAFLSGCFNTIGSYACTNVNYGPLGGVLKPCHFMDLFNFCRFGKCELTNDRAMCRCDAGYQGVSCDQKVPGKELIVGIIALVLVIILAISGWLCLCFLQYKQKMHANLTEKHLFGNKNPPTFWNRRYSVAPKQLPPSLYPKY